MAVLNQVFKTILLSINSNLVSLSLKGTGTQDLILLKVVSLDSSWLVGLTDDLQTFFLIFKFFFLSFVVLAKIMPIANVNRIFFVN